MTGNCGLIRIAWNVSHSETKPLSGGSAEIATQPTRNTNAVCGMRWISPPRCSMSRSPVDIEHRAGAEEQQALEHRMVEHMEQPGGQRKRGGERHAVRLERQRKAERR